MGAAASRTARKIVARRIIGLRGTRTLPYSLFSRCSAVCTACGAFGISSVSPVGQLAQFGTAFSAQCLNQIRNQLAELARSNCHIGVKTGVICFVVFGNSIQKLDAAQLQAIGKHKRNAVVKRHRQLYR